MGRLVQWRPGRGKEGIYSKLGYLIYLINLNFGFRKSVRKAFCFMKIFVQKCKIWD